MALREASAFTTSSPIPLLPPARSERASGIKVGSAAVLHVCVQSVQCAGSAGSGGCWAAGCLAFPIAQGAESRNSDLQLRVATTHLSRWPACRSCRAPEGIRWRARATAAMMHR